MLACKVNVHGNAPAAEAEAGPRDDRMTCMDAGVV